MAKARIDKLIENWDAALQRAFMQSINNITDNAQIEQLTKMIEAGDIEGALRAVQIDPVMFRPFDKTFSEAFEAGGVVAANAIPSIPQADGGRLTFQFSIRNPGAELWLKNHSGNSITEIVADQRAMVRQSLTAGMQAGNNPRTVALDLVGRVGLSGKRVGGAIGLTSTQEQWVRNYASELASDNPADVFSRALRDRRFDPAVRRAIASDTKIPADLQAKMVTAYKNRALRFRAEAIGRTEAMTALHQSQEEAMNQAIQSGLISSRHVAFVWRTAHDTRVRDSHAAMDGQVRQLGEDFETGDGFRLRFPGDPTGPAREIINCRCWREPQVNFLAEAA